MAQPGKGAVQGVDKAERPDARPRIPYPDARLVAAVLVPGRRQHRRTLAFAASVKHSQRRTARRLYGAGQILIAAHRLPICRDDEIPQPQPRRLGGILAAQRRVPVRECHDQCAIGKQLDPEGRTAQLHRAPRRGDCTHRLNRNHPEQCQRNIAACVGRGAVRRHSALLFAGRKVRQRSDTQLCCRFIGVKCIRQSCCQPGNDCRSQQCQQRSRCRRQPPFSLHLHPSLWDSMCS